MAWARASVRPFKLHRVESLALMLRAVNVGQRRVPMAALRTLLESAGFADVRSTVNFHSQAPHGLSAQVA